MPILASLPIGLALGLVLAAAGGYYVWRVWRPRREVFEGRRILAGMRWRELSNLVMDALGPSGFEPEPAEARAERGSHADPVMLRDGRPWLIVCKQGLDHRVTTQAVEEVHRSLRLQHAAGAVVVTPGHVERKAREVVPAIELADGEELWRLLDPLLPASVHEEVTRRARTHAVRQSAFVLAAAAVVAVATTWALHRSAAADPAPSNADALAPATASRNADAPLTPPAAADAPVSTLDEPGQRRELAARMSDLPGVDRALWSTPSTLQIVVIDPQVATDEAICELVRHYELIRASRLQLEPPPGGDRPVRFKQCSVF
ncbi:MAG: restriction endonuclease [Pseudomonadota bacterium]